MQCAGNLPSMSDMGAFRILKWFKFSTPFHCDLILASSILVCSQPPPPGAASRHRSASTSSTRPSTTWRPPAQGGAAARRAAVGGFMCMPTSRVHPLPIPAGAASALPAVTASQPDAAPRPSVLPSPTPHLPAPSGVMCGVAEWGTGMGTPQSIIG